MGCSVILIFHGMSDSFSHIHESLVLYTYFGFEINLDNELLMKQKRLFGFDQLRLVLMPTVVNELHG
jgi:hypothetical protein